MLTATLRLPSVRLPKLRREHWLASSVLGIAAAVYLVAGGGVGSLAGPDGRAFAKPTGGLQTQRIIEAPPEPEPLRFKKVAPQDAVAINASVPVSGLSNPAAKPFVLNAASSADRQRSLECLTAAIYYEAATEAVDGQRAVAQVVLNRVRHPAYPSSVCGVVFQGSERATGCQFTFTCDGSLARRPHPAYWSRARALAEAALTGQVYAPVGWATHYHTNWVVPYWSSSLVKLANVGTHIFYRWEGGWGRGPAFTSRHGGTEPVLAKMSYIGVGGPLEQEAAAEQQEEALASGEITPEALAADPLLARPTSYDPGALNRAIVRRFKPAKREDVADVLAKQTAAGAKVENSHVWALTGAGVAEEGFGKKPAPASEAKPVS